MTDLDALEKHACPACGAQAEWNAARQRLVCPFCGTESPYELDRQTGTVEEIDLVRTLRELPDDRRGWHTSRRTVRCQSCQAVMVFEPERVGQNCEFCGSPALVDYDEIKSPIRPTGVLPFKVSQAQVRDAMRGWFAARWFAPGALKRRALVDTVHGVYIPYWTFDAQAHCAWEAEAGYYYYVNETVRGHQGRSQTRRVQKVRWEWKSGEVDRFFDDEPVPGTQGITLSLLRQVEPFPTQEVVPYDTGFLAGHVVEHYKVVLIDAAKRSLEQMHEKLMAICAAQVPGDTHRNLRIRPDFSGQTFKHVLVPVWLLTYTFGPRRFQVVANGQTGRIAGEYPKSVWKILLLVLAVLAVVGLIIATQQ